MFGSVVLEVSIGLVLTFLLFSIILTSVREGVESWLKQRSKDLEATIMQLLSQSPEVTTFEKRWLSFRSGLQAIYAALKSLTTRTPRVKADTAQTTDQKTLNAFYNHPLIYSLFPGEYKAKPDGLLCKLWNSTFGLRRHLPTYIPRDHFVAAVIKLKNEADALPDEAIATINNVVASASAWGLSERQVLEKWFDGTMERMSGQFKRKTQRWLFVIGFAIASAANINPILIGNQLAHDSTLRADIAALAPDLQKKLCDAADACTISNGTSLNGIQQQFAAAKLPIGWCSAILPYCLNVQHVGWETPLDFKFDTLDDKPAKPIPTTLVLTLLTGWLITAFAGMLGAPFWFDILKSVMNIRSSINPDEAAAKKLKAAKPD